MIIETQNKLSQDNLPLKHLHKPNSFAFYLVHCIKLNFNYLHTIQVISEVIIRDITNVCQSRHLKEKHRLYSGNEEAN